MTEGDGFPESLSGLGFPGTCQELLAYISDLADPNRQKQDWTTPPTVPRLAYETLDSTIREVINIGE